MKPAAAALALLILGALPGAASLLPEDWQSVQIPNAGGTNQWFFFPDAEKKPRIVAKLIANNASVARTTLTGGPDAWAASPSVNTAGLNKEGFFVPSGAESGFLVGPHLASGSYRLRMWSFLNGTVGDSVIDNVLATGFGGVSAAIDPAGNLHAAWVWSPGANESLVYGRRNSSGVWQIDEQIFNRPAGGGADNGIRIGETAVVPSAFGAANIYFTLNSPVTQPVPGTVTSLMRMNTLINAAGLFLENPTVLIEAGVKHTLRGTRVGSLDRVYFFEGNILRRWNGSGATDVQPTAVAGAVPRSIHVAIDPVDGRQRVAWYDSNSKKIHYLKPNATDATYTAFTPVTIPGNGALADADLYGLHFDAAGLPYILYRRAVAEGYVAFPNDEFDVDKNRRAEIVDEALNSPKALIEVLPLGPAAPITGGGTVPNSADRFKVRFPTVVSANPVGPKLESTTKNLRYEVEVSPDGFSWTKLTVIGSITFTKTAETATERTYVGVLPEAAPGILKARFARLIVTRINHPY